MAEDSTDSATTPSATLLTMGVDETGFPLAAIYKTRYGRSLNDDLATIEREAADTDPPQSINEQIDIDFDDVTPPPFGDDSVVSSARYDDFLTVLQHHAPADFDPRAIGDALRTLSAADSVFDDSETAWYRTAFSADTFLTRPPKRGKVIEVEVDFLQQTLGLAGNGRILDIGCGYGRITNSLARRGHAVVGLDLSEDMLRHAQAVATKSDLEVDYVLGDMRQLAYDGEFDAVISTDTSFGYFSDAENLITLHQMASAVRPGGRVLIDTLCRERALVETPSRSWWEGQGCLIQEDGEFDQIASRLKIKRLMVFADGRQHECLISIRLYTASELVELCRLAGLHLVELSGSVHEQGAYFSASSRRLILTLQRG